MKNKYFLFIRNLRPVVASHPVETLLAVAFFIAGVLLSAYGEWDGTLLAGVFAGKVHYGLVQILRYAFILFLATYLLHRKASGRVGRTLYLLMPLLLAAAFWAPRDTCPERYFITLLLIQLAYLLGMGGRSNRSFMAAALHYVRSMAVSVMLACVLFGVLVTISLSVYYIFDFPDRWDVRLIKWSASIAYALVWPLLFLAFEGAAARRLPRGRVIRSLLDWVFSPALLIYAAILYVYMLRIVLTATLPKGGVAAMVMGFVTCLFLMRGCQPLLTQGRYRGFYRYASWVALPTLLLAWVGTFYRINEYGWTVSRVYLVVALVTLSLMALLFLFRRRGRYRTVAGFALITFVAVSYIPGISAPDIERRSQQGRGADSVVVGGSSYFISQSDVPHSSYNIRGYQRMYVISDYHVEHDSVWAYRADTLVYANRLSVLLNEQLRRAGLTPRDSIRPEHYARLLWVETDSLAILLESMRISRHGDTLTLDYLKPDLYLKP